MKVPWADKSGLAKAVAVLATIGLVSAGLCGLNFVAAIGLENRSWALGPLMVGAYVETVGMVIGVAGLLVVAMIGVGKLVVDRLRGREKGGGE